MSIKNPPMTQADYDQWAKDRERESWERKRRFERWNGLRKLFGLKPRVYEPTFDRPVPPLKTTESHKKSRTA